MNGAAGALPGTLTIRRGAPNPNGAREAELFLIAGDASVPVARILPDPDAILPARRAPSPQSPFRLRILHFNDLHGHIARFTPEGVQPVFSRMAWRIRQARDEVSRSDHVGLLVLSGGDDIGDSAFDELLTPEDGAGAACHPAYTLYAEAGVDAAVLGNHDFDRGLEPLARAISQAPFPVLSANLRPAGDVSLPVYPAVLFVLRGVRVGIIGLTTRAELKLVEGARWTLLDPLEAAQNLVPALRPYCDVLIILSHLGGSLGIGTCAVQDIGDRELAELLPASAVDLIVGAHSHQPLNEAGLHVENVVNGIPIVQAGAGGKYLGEVTITLRPRPAVTDARLWSVPYLPIREDLEQRFVAPLTARAAKILGQVLGTLACEPDYRDEAVRSDFAAGENALANFIADALVQRCRRAGFPVDLGMIDASCLCGGLPEGDVVRYGDWFRVQPYEDPLYIGTLSWADFLEFLQDNARRVDRPGEPRVERGFAHFSGGLRYTIRLGGGRQEHQVCDVTFRGKPLRADAERTMTIAFPGFFRHLAAPWERVVGERYGMACFPGARLSPAPAGLFVRRELVAYIREVGGITPAAGARCDGRLTIVQ